MKSCHEVASLREQYLALDLDVACEGQIRAHLADCAACREVFMAAEPTLRASLALASAPLPEDDLFVSQVMAGIRQRRVERQIGRRHRWWMGMAAAAVLMIAGSTATYLRLQGGTELPPAQVAAGQSAMEPAFVAVEGVGVRLYQLTTGGSGKAEVQVAFIVDPQLEL